MQAAAPSFVLTTGTQRQAPLAAPADCGTKQCDPYQSACAAQRVQAFLLSGAVRVRRKICMKELLCQGREIPLSLHTRTSAGVPVLSASKGEDAAADSSCSSRHRPLCILSPQASSACSEGGRTLPCAKPAGRAASLPPWPRSPTAASLQSRGGEGEGRGYCPNALSHVVTLVQCPTQLSITTRVKLSSTVSE